MRDIVTKSHLNQFVEQYGFQNKSECEAFELFAIYSILTKYINIDTIEQSTLESINIGNGGDWGIDGFVLIVNGRLVTNREEIIDLLKMNGALSVQIVLIQAKTSHEFKTSEIGQFYDGVTCLFSEISDPSIEKPNSNEELDTYRILLNNIYQQSASFLNSNNPSLDVYYVTCGDYSESPDHRAKTCNFEKNLKRLDLTGSINTCFLGRRDIVSYYKAAKSKIEVEIQIERKLPLPEISNIDEAYLCLIPFKEFRKIILDTENKIVPTIFYDNIRAFQGENTVNKAMRESLRKGDTNLFAAMNNGITIISKTIKTVGTKVHMKDYQIVNGCQTCNVLSQNIDVKGIDDLMLTVKLIASGDSMVRDKIIIGTNSQTEVKREQFVALLDSQRQIEDYYNAQTQFEKLYYERRSKQYRFEETGIPTYKIITIPFQIKAFVSMIMGEPHKVRGYYGQIVDQLDKNGSKVFDSQTHPSLYYMSALACYKMEQAFSQHTIDRRYKKVKYHLLLACRLKAQKCDMPCLNSNRIQQYCDDICKTLCDKEKCVSIFKESIKLIDQALGGKEPKDSDSGSISLTNTMKSIIAKNS